MKSAAFVLVGLLLLLVQGTIHRVFAGLAGIGLFGFELGHVLSGATPSLVLPLVVYLGIHEQSMARGALLSFVLGWGLDVFGGGPAFLFRFTMVAIWWLSRTASTRVSSQSPVTRMPLAFAASVIESAFVLTLLAIFGMDNKRPLELSYIVLPRAISTALVSPLLFSLAHRLSFEGWGSSSAPTGQGAS